MIGGYIHIYDIDISIYIKLQRVASSHVGLFQRPTLWFFKKLTPAVIHTATTQLATPSGGSHPSKRFAARFPSLLPLFCSVETGRNAHAQSIARFYKAPTACRVGGTSNVPQELKKRSGEKAAERPLLRNRGIIIIVKSGKNNGNDEKRAKSTRENSAKISKKKYSVALRKSVVRPSQSSPIEIGKERKRLQITRVWRDLRTFRVLIRYSVRETFPFSLLYTYSRLRFRYHATSILRKISSFDEKGRSTDAL